MKRILIINSTDRIENQSFIKKDNQLLTEVYETIVLDNVPKYNLLKILRSLPKHIKIAKNCDVIYGWWLYNFYAIIVGIFSRKNVILVSGGTDTANIKEINYGSFGHPLLKRIIKFCLKFVHHIIFVDESLVTQLKKNYKKKLPEYSSIQTGFNFSNWKFENKDKKYILTVASNKFKNINKIRTRFLVKGIDRFFNFAKSLSEEEFILIGFPEEDIKSIDFEIPKNVKIVGFCPFNVLQDYYQKSILYCQFSRHEGFPSSVCEAGLSGCYTVGNDVNGIKKAGGNSATVFNFDNSNENDIFNQIKEIFHNLKNKKEFVDYEKYKKYINNKFSFEVRKEKLKQLIDNI